ncbi:MAG: arginyltransferase [bacterium]|nr:arginyltransferase [bacterium]
MSIRGVLLQPTVDQCPYLEGMVTVNENLYVKELDERDLERFLSMGFRHFGEVFFRPICAHCRSCIPLRVPVEKFSPSKSVRRLFNRNSELTVTLGKPEPSEELFELYKHHKLRFNDKRAISESYEQYVESFFYPYPFNRMLTIRLNHDVVAVSHLDVTSNVMSAIYCYFDARYSRYSPGKFAVYKEIMLAKEMGLKWLYLGYYIARNRHTNYKVRFKPNQAMADENQWIDYTDEEGNVLNPLPRPGFRLLADYGT